MKPGLQLRLSQHLALTPQLQQSIRLLQLSTLELQLEIGQMLQSNPFLEMEEEDGVSAWDESFSTPEPSMHTGLDGVPLQDQAASHEYSDTNSNHSDLSANDFDTTDRDDWENGTEHDDFDSIRELPSIHSLGNADLDDSDRSAPEAYNLSLVDHLHAQLAGMHLSNDDRTALEVLIQSVNEEGYLDDELDVIAHQLLLASDDSDEDKMALLDQLQVALRWLQSMEPAGVGARNLSECLHLQLLRLTPNPERDLAIVIVQSHLDLLAKRDTKKLLAATQSDEQTLQWAQNLIRQCTPRPGLAFTPNISTTVTPDVLVQRSGQTFRVIINPDVMPRLRVNDYYARAIRAQGRGNASHLTGHLQEARWFIKNIQQRFDTIWRVSSAIVERQKAFFIHGEIAMKPMIMRDIAEELDLHESTISRVTTAKYMATPLGTFELKYFFGSGLSTDAGGAASSTAVRALIKQFIVAENSKKPLSDSKVADLLLDQGIQVARRTVAKYRESLKIAPANLRKAL